MLTKEEKLKLKPTTDKLKMEYAKKNKNKLIVDNAGWIDSNFMFWVVARYENKINKTLKITNSELIKLYA